MEKKTRYFQRLSARTLDLLVAGLIVLTARKISPHAGGGVVIFFFLYNLTTILCGGKTLGKHAFSLKIQSADKGLKRVLALSFRETLLFVLFPFLALNCIFISDTPLHDKIAGVQVVKDER